VPCLFSEGKTGLVHRLVLTLTAQKERVVDKSFATGVFELLNKVAHGKSWVTMSVVIFP